MMRNRYPSAEKIANCTVPLHQSHGDKDILVPFDSGQRLFDASPATKKKFFLNKGKGHWDYLPTAYWNEVKQFIDQVNPDNLPIPDSNDENETTDPGESLESNGDREPEFETGPAVPSQARLNK